MALVSWAKKELSRLKLQKPAKRLTLPEISTSTKCLAHPLIQEVVLDADLRCAHCQNRVTRVISNIEVLLKGGIELKDRLRARRKDETRKQKREKREINKVEIFRKKLQIGRVILSVN